MHGVSFVYVRLVFVWSPVSTEACTYRSAVVLRKSTAVLKTFEQRGRDQSNSSGAEGRKLFGTRKYLRTTLGDSERTSPGREKHQEPKMHSSQTKKDRVATVTCS